MELSFWASDAVLLVAQSALVALPRPRALPWLERLGGRLQSRWWALVPLASIVGAIVAITASSASASFLTWLALIAVPLLAAFALGFVIHGARPWLAPLAGGLFALAWADRSGLAGEGAALLLSALSCATLGVLLTAVAPRSWLKVGIVLMAAADVYLIATQKLQHPNDVLNAAAPPAQLPQLQRVEVGDAVMGYGDLFIAGVFGALLAAERRPQVRVALLTLALAAAYDCLFFVTDVLPATVPIAVALMLLELWSWTRRRSRRRNRHVSARV
jgi:hypothetical protein